MVDPMVEAAIYERYPGLRALLGIPEVGDLLVQAVNPETPFSQQEFERRLHETNWWKTTPAPHRDYTIQGIEDPATQANILDNTFAGVAQWATNMGIHMLGEEMLFVSAAMMQRGTSLDDPANQRALRAWMQQHPDRVIEGGRIDQLGAQISALSHGQYFVPVSEAGARGWAIDIATGAMDQAGLQTRLNDHAMVAFPHLAEMLGRGQTPADIINPMRELAAKELEIDMNTIDPLSPTWSFMTGMADSKAPSGYRLPTYSEVQRRAREQSQWWATANGQQTDASLSRTLLEAFGKRAF